MMLRYLAIAALVLPAAASAQSRLAGCMNAGTETTTYDPLRGKIALTGGATATTFPMMTIQDKATESEKTAMAALAELYTGCMRDDTAWRRTIPPDAAAILEAATDRFMALLARLYNGELTYGQFNTERSEMGQRLRTALASIQQREQARAQASEEADYQARRAAALQYLMGQQPVFRPTPLPQPYQLPPLPPTVTTNCYRFGNQTTCSSR